jgi:polyferredoxin
MFVTLSDGGIRNAYTLRFSNKWGETRAFEIGIADANGLVMDSPELVEPGKGGLRLAVAADATRAIRVFVTAPKGASLAKSTPISFVARDLENSETVNAGDHFFAP